MLLKKAPGLIFVFVVAFFINAGCCVKITIEQMQQASEPIRMVCVQKTKIGEDVLANLRAGKLDDSKELKCYVNCVFEMMQVMKKGKLMYDAVIKSVETMLPDELREDTRRAIDVCQSASVNIKKDYCEAAYVMLKCIYKENPNFFFP